MTRASFQPAIRRLTGALALLPAGALAQAAADGPGFKPPVGAPSVVGVATSLVLVIGAIFLVGWLYSRAQRIRGGSAGDIRVVAVQPLGARERIVIVQIAGKQFVVGVTPQSISTLHTFDGQAVDRTAGVPGAGFAGRLRAALGGRT